MPTYDLTKGSQAAIPGHERATTFLRGKIEFAKQNLAQNDVAKLINVPANTQVLGVFWQVTEAAANAGTFNFGDAALATRYGSALALNAVAKGNSVTNFFYTVGDTINIVQAAALTVSTGVLKVIALVGNYDTGVN